ncbi:hypothetical protein ABT390_00010 [Streptomyces aurantiacus]|uniref:Uncharacterized protein n=1 Tax=Streptomyces aurantiacus JA 4570 TaxID=1286094 RepID=S3ZTT9_9ACTN|nr:hypothetical protein [Streptomyces aurantiacus]EPH46184.1 hypothetical protein STRAU_0735 [Streptomyces aurantiacus JA 4570]
MPRPTAAQLAYGSATVICSALAMLLLSQAGSVPGIAVITFAALGLGLLVALTVPVPKPAPEPAAAPAAAPADAPLEERIPVPRTLIAPETAPQTVRPVREPAGP